MPIHEDLRQIRNYLTIQKLRFGSKIQIEILVEREIESFYTLKLLIQPIVENAIIHGLEPKKEAGKLRIIGRSLGGSVQFVIQDDGVGFDKEAVRRRAAQQLAEIDSAFGIAGLADTGALTPLRQELATADGKRIDARFTASYRYEDQLWALPYGGSVPVVYCNADLLGSAGAASASALAPFTWGRMTALAKELTLDVDKDGETDIWGLAADRDTPWYLENMIASESASGRDSRVPAYSLWHDLVYRDGIMPPLDNHLATSDFINGQAAFLFASSDKRTTLERYIGGKFEFGVLPFPEIEGRHALLPRTSGFVMLQAGAAETGISRQLLQYLIGDEVQSSLLGDGGQFPVRADMIGSMKRDAELTDKERAVIGMIGRIDAAGAANPRGIAWQKLLDVQEKLESSSAFGAGG